MSGGAYERKKELESVCAFQVIVISIVCFDGSTKHLYLVMQQKEYS